MRTISLLLAQLIPNEIVIMKGHIGHEMYFISDGTLDVYIDFSGEEGEVPNCALEAGAYFGEPAILSKVSHDNNTTHITSSHINTNLKLFSLGSHFSIRSNEQQL